MFINSAFSGRLPSVLDESELNRLIKSAQKGNSEDRDKIIYFNVRLVLFRISNRFSPSPYDYDDLVSIGIIGLIKAVDSFNIDKNIKFITYASRCIDNEILNFFRRDDKHLFIYSVDENIKDSDKSVIENIIDNDTNIEDDLEEKELRSSVINIINELPLPQQQLINLTFGFNGEKEHTQEELATILGFSQPHICRMKKAILKKVKSKLINERSNNRQYIKKDVVLKK